jgi:hypothetical protein
MIILHKCTKTKRIVQIDRGKVVIKGGSLSGIAGTSRFQSKQALQRCHTMKNFLVHLNKGALGLGIGSFDHQAFAFRRTRGGVSRNYAARA